MIKGTNNTEVQKLCQMSAMPFVKHFNGGSADHTDNSVLVYIAGPAFCTSITRYVESKKKIQTLLCAAVDSHQHGLCMAYRRLC